MMASYWSNEYGSNPEAYDNLCDYQAEEARVIKDIQQLYVEELSLEPQTQTPNSTSISVGRWNTTVTNHDDDRYSARDNTQYSQFSSYYGGSRYQDKHAYQYPIMDYKSDKDKTGQHQSTEAQIQRYSQIEERSSDHYADNSLVKVHSTKSIRFSMDTGNEPKYTGSETLDPASGTYEGRSFLSIPGFQKDGQKLSTSMKSVQSSYSSTSRRYITGFTRGLSQPSTVSVEHHAKVNATQRQLPRSIKLARLFKCCLCRQKRSKCMSLGNPFSADFHYDNSLSEEQYHLSTKSSSRSISSVNLPVDISSDELPITTHTFLLIQAPLDRNVFPYEKDNQARLKQFDQFCELYPRLKGNTSHVTRSTVNTSSDIYNSIENFINGSASRSIMGIIVFNGHGSRNGFCLSNDNPVPLDIIISQVTTVQEGLRETSTLPHLVRIVFAQCYGHMYTEPEQQDIHVISFTNANLQRTLVTIKFDRMTKDVVDSSHRQLNEHAVYAEQADNILKTIRLMRTTQV